MHDIATRKICIRGPSDVQFPWVLDASVLHVLLLFLRSRNVLLSIHHCVLILTPAEIRIATLNAAFGFMGQPRHVMQGRADVVRVMYYDLVVQHHAISERGQCCTSLWIWLRLIHDLRPARDMWELFSSLFFTRLNGWFCSIHCSARFYL